MAKEMIFSKEFKKYLFVGSHPDDTEFFCGGTIKKLVSAKKQAIYLILTSGSKAYFSGLNESELIKARKKEQKRAAKVLGVTKIFYLDKYFTDKKILYTDNNIKVIHSKIKRINPDIIFCPAYVKDFSFWNKDHRITGEIIKEVAKRLNKQVVFYGTYNHNLLVSIDEEYKIATKAINQHKSQMRSVGKLYLFLRNIFGRYFGRKKGCIMAEPFLIHKK